MYANPLLIVQAMYSTFKYQSANEKNCFYNVLFKSLSINDLKDPWSEFKFEYFQHDVLKQKCANHEKNSVEK